MKEDQKIVIYQTPDGKTQIDVRLEDETVWLTQAQMAELFEKDRTVIGRHISNVFKERELVREEVSAKIAHTTRHSSRWDRYLGMTAAMTQVPVPTAIMLQR